MNAHPLAAVGVPIDIAGMDARLSTSTRRSGGQSFRLSVEITQESFNALSAYPELRRLLLNLSVSTIGETDKVVGGWHSNQAGILCRDSDFQSWIAHRLNIPAKEATETVAAKWLRTNCGVESRAELDGNDVALGRYRQVMAAFNNYLMGCGLRPRHLQL